MIAQPRSSPEAETLTDEGMISPRDEKLMRDVVDSVE